MKLIQEYKKNNFRIPKNIAVIYGGVSAETDICSMEGERIIELLYKYKHTVYPIKIDKDTNYFTLLQNSPKCAILCLSEDVGIQWVLEQYEIKYNGSGSFATMLSLDKILVKQILINSTISTPPFQILNNSSSSQKTKIELDYPLVVKPARSGSSHGISLVKRQDQIQSAIQEAIKDDNQILIEEFIPGIEITIVCLGNRILGIIELDKKGDLMYDYDTKLKGHISYIEPARISIQSRKYIYNTIPKLVDIFSIRNLFRVDAIVKDNTVYILEINTLPFLAEGGEPYEAVKSKGWTMYDLLTEVVYDFTVHKKLRPLD